MSEFHKRWMRLWAWGVVLFGVAIALFAIPATDGLMRVFFGLGLGNPIPAEADPHFRFSMALMGCVSIGWGFTFLAAFEAGHQLTGAAATKFWRGMMLAVCIWFVTDSIFSVTTGFWRNVISNAALMFLFLLPILKSGALKEKT